MNSGIHDRLFNNSISTPHFSLNQTNQLLKNTARIFICQKYVPLASSFSALFHFALDWRFSSGTAMKKAAWNENNSSIFSLAYYFRFNLTNTTCCGYNYLVPQNSVAAGLFAPDK
jgi:hypothetical protein